LSGYRSIAVQTVAGYLIVIGWLLTSKETQEIARDNPWFLAGSSLGLVAICVMVIATLMSYFKRSEHAFEQLKRIFGQDEEVLGCYRIKPWNLYTTSVFIALIALSSLFHLHHVCGRPSATEQKAPPNAASSAVN
jgi:hypothetical protein